MFINATKSRFNKKHLLIVLTAIAFVVTGLTMIPKADAAPGSCYASGYVRTPNGLTKAKHYCNVYKPAPMYNGSRPSSWVTGHMNPGRSWVVCQIRTTLQNPTVAKASGGRSYNNVWLYTLGDDGKWGYLPATFVSQGGDGQYVPGVPNCIG